MLKHIRARTLREGPQFYNSCFTATFCFFAPRTNTSVGITILVPIFSHNIGPSETLYTDYYYIGRDNGQ